MWYLLATGCTLSIVCWALFIPMLFQWYLAPAKVPGRIWNAYPAKFGLARFWKIKSSATLVTMMVTFTSISSLNGKVGATSRYAHCSTYFCENHLTQNWWMLVGHNEVHLSCMKYHSSNRRTFPCVLVLVAFAYGTLNLLFFATFWVTTINLHKCRK